MHDSLKSKILIPEFIKIFHLSILDKPLYKIKYTSSLRNNIKKENDNIVEKNQHILNNTIVMERILK